MQQPEIDPNFDPCANFDEHQRLREEARKREKRVGVARTRVGLFIAGATFGQSDAPRFEIKKFPEEPAAVAFLADELSIVLNNPSARFSAAYWAPQARLEDLYLQVETRACQVNPGRLEQLEAFARAAQDPACAPDPTLVQ